MITGILITPDYLCTDAAKCVDCLEKLIGEARRHSKGEEFNSSLDEAFAQVASKICSGEANPQNDGRDQNFCIAKICAEVFFLAGYHTGISVSFHFQACTYLCKRTASGETLTATMLRYLLEQCRAEKLLLGHRQSSANHLLHFLRRMANKPHERNPVGTSFFSGHLPDSFPITGVDDAYAAPPARTFMATHSPNIQQNHKRNVSEAGFQESSESISGKRSTVHGTHDAGQTRQRLTIDLATKDEKAVSVPEQLSDQVATSSCEISRPDQLQPSSVDGFRQGSFSTPISDCQRSNEITSDIDIEAGASTQYQRSSHIYQQLGQINGADRYVSRSNGGIDIAEPLSQTSSDGSGLSMGQQHQCSENKKTAESDEDSQAEKSWDALLNIIHTNMTAGPQKTAVVRSAQDYGGFRIAQRKKLSDAKAAAHAEYARLKSLAASDQNQWTEFVCRTRIKDEEEKWQARNRVDLERCKRLPKHSDDTIRNLEQSCAEKDRAISQIEADFEKQVIELDLRYAEAVKQQALAVDRANNADEACALAGELKERWKKKTLDLEADLVKEEGQLLQGVAKRERCVEEKNEISRAKALLEKSVISLEAKLALVERQLSQETIQQKRATRERDEISKAKAIVEEKVAMLEAKVTRMEEHMCEEVKWRVQVGKENHEMKQAKAVVEEELTELRARLVSAEEQVSRLTDTRESDAQTSQSEHCDKKKRLKLEYDSERSEEPETPIRGPKTSPNGSETRQREPVTRKRGAETRSQRRDKLKSLYDRGSKMLK